MRELTGDTIIRVRRPRPEPRKRELTGDTRVRLSQIKGLAEDRKYQVGEISQKTGLQKQPDGSWAEPHKNTKKAQVKQKVSAGDKINIKPSDRDPATIKTATLSQKKSLENYSCSVDVSKIDTNAIKIVDKTVRTLIRDYKMRPLVNISTYNELGGPMGQSDGDSIFLNEDFYNDPGRYYDYMIENQNYAIDAYEEGKTRTPLEDKEEEYNRLLNEMKQLTVRGNALYKGREIECVTLHEMAHVLYKQRFEELTGIEKLVLDQQLEEAFNNAKETGDINTVSLYALKSKEEFFAESFVVYKMGIEKLPATITAMIGKVIK